MVAPVSAIPNRKCRIGSNQHYTPTCLNKLGLVVPATADQLSQSLSRLFPPTATLLVDILNRNFHFLPNQMFRSLCVIVVVCSSNPARFYRHTAQVFEFVMPQSSLFGSTAIYYDRNEAGRRWSPFDRVHMDSVLIARISHRVQAAGSESDACNNS